MEAEAQANPILNQLLVRNELHDRVRGRLSARLSEPSVRAVNSVDDRLGGPGDTIQAAKRMFEQAHAAFDVGRRHGRKAQPQAPDRPWRSWTSLHRPEDKWAPDQGDAAAD